MAGVQVAETIIDFHLVEKCRTKFRAFVKSYGAKVKFDPVGHSPRKQEYQGTVTITRACKQQFLTNHLQVLSLLCHSPAPVASNSAFPVEISSYSGTSGKHWSGPSIATTIANF